jgi:hypothetical protein
MKAVVHTDRSRFRVSSRIAHINGGRGTAVYEMNYVKKGSYRCGEVCARGQRYWWRMWAGVVRGDAGCDPALEGGNFRG